jgi:hypothetical protein
VTPTVKAQAIQWAVANKETVGIWGRIAQSATPVYEQGSPVFTFAPTNLDIEPIECDQLTEVWDLVALVYPVL